MCERVLDTLVDRDFCLSRPTALCAVHGLTAPSDPMTDSLPASDDRWHRGSGVGINDIRGTVDKDGAEHVQRREMSQAVPAGSHSTLNGSGRFEVYVTSFSNECRRDPRVKERRSPTEIARGRDASCSF